MMSKTFEEFYSKLNSMSTQDINNALVEASINLEKCTEPFAAQDISKQQQETINHQKAEIERLKHLEKNVYEAVEELTNKIKTEAVKEFAEELIYKIVNTPTKFESTYYMYREGIAFRQNEIIDIIKEMAGEEK